MAKKVVGFIKLQIPGGQANPAPPVGPALGQHQVNIMQFCQAFNAATQDKMGTIIPVEITVYEDRSLRLHHQDPAGRRAAQAGRRHRVAARARPNRTKVAQVTRDQVRQIAETKMPDLNANDVEAAMKIIAGTARSMGIDGRRLAPTQGSSRPTGAA